MAEEDTPPRFCADFLAVLRRHGISYRRAEVLSGWGKSTIATAARGPGLPNVELVADVLCALGTDAAEVEGWRARHARLSSRVPDVPSPPDTPPDTGADTASPGAAELDLPSEDTTPSPPGSSPTDPLRSDRRRARRRLEVAAFLAVALVAVGLGIVLALRQGGDASRTVVVQNKVAFGPSSLIEDDSPSYLGARPVARCANLPGCKLAGTDLYSGDTLRAECQLQGAFITNADVTSAGIGQNPNAATSSLWLGARAPDGRRGYISEVYLAPPYRGGLGLPAC